MSPTSNFASVLVVLLACVAWCGCGSGTDGPRSAALIATAQEALVSGDKAAAIEAVTKAIEIEPTAWAYALRSRIYAENGSDEMARSDCAAGLKLDEHNEKLNWILRELDRPVEKRFQVDQPSSK